MKIEIWYRLKESGNSYVTSHPDLIFHNVIVSAKNESDFAITYNENGKYVKIKIPYNNILMIKEIE